MTKTNYFPVSMLDAAGVDAEQTIQPSILENSRHLIILVPANLDGTGAIRRICNLAVETNASIQLLGLYKDESEEYMLRRELATMSALIRDARIFVEIVIKRGANWVDALKYNYCAGDILVCISDPSIGIRRRPLSQILESNFAAPVYVFSETANLETKPNLVSQVLAWSGLVAIMAGFFVVQVKIIQYNNGGFQSLLLLLTILPELWLIQVWNSLFF